MNNKAISFRTVWALLATCLYSATANATPEILDWDTLMWLPEGNTNLSETYSTGTGNITVTFGGNVADLDQAGGVISPAINAENTGGLMPVENGLYVATDYVDASNPMVTVTLDFTGYPGGVGNLEFTVFDMDLGGTFIDQMTVTADTLTGTIDPTSIGTSASNVQIGNNTVRGTAGAGPSTSDGNATFVFGDAGTPVAGITRINITWANEIGTANPGFQWINIHDFSFDDPIADAELTKSVAPASADVGETVVFTLDVVNNGPDAAPGTQVTDQLPAGFTYLSDNGGGSYDPVSGIWDAGTLPPGGAAQLTIDARAEAGGPWDNSAEVTRWRANDTDSTPGNNVPAEDDQDNAVVTVTNPQIGTAKRVLAAATNNGDGTYTLTYSVTVENFGDVPLSNLQLVDDLATTFAGTAGFVIDSLTSPDFTVNPGFNGNADTNVLAGTDTIAVGVSGTVDFTVTVDAAGNLGPFDNTATANGTSPRGTGVSDDSTSGTNADPDGDGNPGNNSVPTPISFTENPQIGVAKALNAGPVNNGDGSHTLTYRFTVENFGDGPLNSVQITDNLATTYSGATGFVVDSVTSSDLTPNPGFDGNGDTSVLAGTDGLIVGETGTVDVTVTVTPGGNLGPYDNNSFARAQSASGSLTLDNSVNGLDPDPDGNGDPVDNNSPTPVSFSENPEIGIAKAITAGPANNGDGSFTLTYTIAVENSGDVALNNVQMVDNLAATYAGATGFVVDSVTSADFATNAGYDGSGDTNLLAGSDTLAIAASGSIALTITVTPGGNLGPYDNNATGSGTSPAGTGVVDVSTAGANPDPDGDGNPGNNSAPTPVSFSEAPEIGTAKAITAGPANNGDGTFTLTYTIAVENSGDVALNNLQVTDNLAGTYAGATGFVVDSVTSADFATNAGYDGSGDTNLLAGSDTLAIAASGSIALTITVTPGGNLGPYDNNATGSGTSPAGTGVVDVSTAGANPDPDGDGNPGNNSAPTPVSFSEAPEIGTAKALTAGPANNGDGTFTLTYTIAVENSGDVALNNLQVTDNLAGTYAGATGFVVDSVTSADFATNAGYNGAGDTNLLAGTDTLAIAGSGSIAVTVTVTPGGNLGPYDNNATGSGTSPAGTGVNDVSTAGANPDPDGDGNPGNNSAPTPVSFSEAPEIGTAKALTAGPANNGDGTFTLTYTIAVENSGDVALNNLQVTDNLAGTYAGATGFVVDSVTSADFATNAGYDGAGDTNLLAGTDTLAIAGSGSIAVTVTVTPGGNLGPYDNNATGSGTSPAGTGVNDVSTAGANPDPDGDGNPGNNSAPTPVSFSEAPEIGTAKALTAGPANNGDGTFTLTYTVAVENSGDVALNNVQVTDNLAGTYAGATGFVVDSVSSADFVTNPGYDGSGDTNLLAGSDTLAIAASGTVNVTVTVTPGSNLGPYDNNATASGTSPAGTGVNDVSTTGANPDPDSDGNPGNNSTPTPVIFGENPQIGVAKALTAGPVNNGDGTYTLTYTMTVENFGDVVLDSVQVVDNLAGTYSGATGFVVNSVTSADFAVNAGYDGAANTNLLAGSDTLAIGASGTIALAVTVTPGGNLGPYDNAVFAQGFSPAGGLTLDNSVDGLDPDPDGNGDPVDNTGPTPVSFGESPEIGTAKAITSGPVNNGDGTFTLTYTVAVANSGDVALNNVQVVDDLAATYSGATGVVVDSVTSADFATNAGYDGAGDTNLLAGSDTLTIAASGSIAVTVTVTPGANLGPYDNSATASGTSPAGTGVNDVSTTGANPDPDGDGNPGNNSAPTPVSFSEAPEIGTAKAITTGPANNGDGTFTLTYTIAVENSGDVALNNVQVTDDLAATYAGATGVVVDSVTSADFVTNAGYDAAGDTNLLAGTDTLAIAGSGSIAVTVTVTPGANLGPYDNNATASGNSPAGTGVNDVSTTGVNPDPDSDGNPGNNSTPTPVIFGEDPQIGVAKALTAGPVNNGDGTYTLTYTMTVENFGDVALNSVQVVDNLSGTYSGATGFVVDSVISADFAINAGYDGAGDTNLLAGTDTLALAASGTLNVTVTVTPGGSLGPYDNAVFAQGLSPAGGLTLDNSVDGLDPDPDGNGDPVDNTSPTPVNFGESPEIGNAKAITAGPVNNGDGTFTLTYTITVENSGDVPLGNVQVTDDLAVTYAGATGFVVDSVASADFAVNTSYDGSGDTSLLAGTDSLAIGASGTLDVTITVTPGGSLGPYDNNSTASGTSPGGTGVNDISTVGGDPDPDGDANPGNNSTPTTLVFGENPVIGTAKSVSAPVDNGNGTFTLTYTITVENSGDVALNSVQVTDDLAATYAGAGAFVADSVSSGDFAVNPGYDGSGDTNLLAGADTLAIGGSGALDITVTVTPGGNNGPYDNTAVASGLSPSGVPVSDVSTSGADPDPGNDGPADDMTPTPVSFATGVAALEGNAWLDQDIDDLFDNGEPPLEGWIIEVLQNGVVVATVPVAADGSYSVGNLPPGSGYSVQLRNPASNAVFGTLENITLPPGLTVIDQNLPIDPSGVVYDSLFRLPVPGVVVTIVDSGGTPLPASCLLPGQQDQVTGADGLYRFDLILGADPACVSGSTFDIVFTVPAGYVPGVSTTILPEPGALSATGLPDPFQVQPQAGAPQAGASTLYYLSFLLSAGDPNIINNHIPIDPVVSSADITITKRADRRQTSVGDLVLYAINVENLGTAIDDLTLTDLIPAGFTYVPGSARIQPAAPMTVTGQRPVVFDNIAVAAGGSVQLRYMLRVGAGVVQGDYTNTVTSAIRQGAFISAGPSASATVAVTADPDFEQTSIVGMAYNDANGNGWQDEGEAGIPGVRLATVEGLVIETDAFGRFHIAGVDGGRHDRGRNFIIKVDPASLPDGAEFTTENPRVQRITEGLLNRFDFGVRMPASACCQEIDVKIGEIFFEQGSSAVRPEFMPLVRQLADRLRESGGGTLFIEGHAAPAEAVAYTADAYTVTQHFAPRSATLSAADKSELDAIVAKWRGVENVSVAAVGHTCNTPIAPKNRKEFKDNYELSRARAQAVASYVRLGLSISPEQVTIEGKGPDEPVASNATPEGGAMNRRVELTVSGQRTQSSSSAAGLARDRANQVLEMLRGLLGDDLVRNIKITTGEMPPAGEKQELEMSSNEQHGWLTRSAGALLGVLVGTANADPMPAACTVDSCRTDEGYVIQIVPSSGAPSPNDTRAALASDQRVDVSGRFSVPVSGGGMLWATEDPSSAQPRLALHGPEIAAVAGGRLAKPVSFFVYSNYAAFIDKAEIQIYHGDNIDLIEPLAVVPFKPGVFSHVEWAGDESRPLRIGDELYYRVRAYDDKGRYDETQLEHVRLVSVDEYERSPESDTDALVPDDARMQKTSRSALGPLDGNVLVLQPPTVKQTMTRGSYTLTPHFDTRKTTLKPQDKAELDSIVSQWAGAKEIRLHVVGHTDNIRIAPQHRNEFRDNQALSEARARSVADYVAGRLGLARSQIVSEGRAAREPVAPNDTAAGRARNRRVEVTITAQRPAAATTMAAGATLVEPHSNTVINITETLDEALNLIGARLGDSTSTATGRRYADASVAQASAHALEAIYGRSDLRLQRIPVNGSRVRINGQDIGGNTALRINGDPVPLDSAGKYAVEYLMPVGQHDFDVELVDQNGRVSDRRSLPVEVSGKHIFLVALADLTVSDNSVSGSIEPLRADDRYDDDLLVEGRLAFYLKGKIKGKYLITAQLDSQEEEIGNLFSNLLDKDPKSVLRRLDPDRYYPVYGDDSTTINDIDTQGRFYFRADWDRSRATWGNFHTGFTGNEFAQYNRSLYGAQYIHESLNVTSKGEAKSQAIGFVSEAQTGFGHSEFIGTGGSLYYLKHQDILPGSEKAWIEVRDRDSDRVRELITLARGIDYEVDEIQGRIILSRPLMQVSRLHAPGIVKDSPLDGDQLVLLVDYEYIPTGFSPDKVTVGGRGKYWLTDDIAIGATLVDETRQTEDYSLLGGDILWQPGEGTYVKAEFAQSEASQAERFQSSDGGLTFDATTPVAAGRAGDAWGIEARVNSREAMNTDNEWVGGGWYRRTDDNFSVARRDPGVDTTEYGVELTGHLSDRMDIAARASVVERETLDEDRRLSLQVDYALTDISTVSGELRNVEETRTGASADGTILALRYSHSLNDAVEVYGIGQFTLANDSGRYDNNDLATIGASVSLNGSTTVQGEYSSGHRGEGALLSLDHRLNDRHEVYGTFTQSADRTDLREPGTRIAFGHRSRITDQATLFNERQFIEDRGQAGLAHVFGLDFSLDGGWGFGISMQQGDLDTKQGRVDRDAATLTANYRSSQINWRGKAEYRDEKGISEISQVLTTNRLDMKLSEDWRLLTRLNYSETEDSTLTDRDDSALFTEAGIGFAYRPVANSRLNLLAKYTYLYDLPSTDQIDGGTDQRSHVVALEGIYRLNPRWEVGGKVAQRSGELRIDRDFGQWFESTTNFFAARGRYHLVKRWDAMIEYRTLDVDEAGSTRDGWLVSLDRHMNDHFRLGLGYNFTDFSDDLTNLDYDHQGWFLNAVGKY